MQLDLPLPELSATAQGSLTPPRIRRIHCNRNLRLDQIDWVGFDMDYTLAIYAQDEMDRLAIDRTVDKLVTRGYPESLRTLPYRTDFAVRGLHVDKKTGNVLKMDRYRYVKKAYHGMRQLSRDERRALYHRERVRMGPRYHWVDTLYALSEVTLYSHAVEHLESLGGEVDHSKLFEDIREGIDLSHRDGSILDVVVADLPRYVLRDPLLGTTLHKLRSAGKKLFVLTNSQADYTERMMSYLLDGALAEYGSWKQYFDVVVVAAQKPRFFTESIPLLEILPDGQRVAAQSLEDGHVYANGNLVDFERLLGAQPDRVLYVGDHIYGDVLRAKKETAWRTAMILQEMAHEVAAHERVAVDLGRIDQLEDARATLSDEVRARQHRLKELQNALEAHAADAAMPGDDADVERPSSAQLEAQRAREKRAIDRSRARLRAVENELDALEDLVDTQFHPFWGSIFKCGPEVSSFGDQVERFACLYTERVSNLLVYSPMHYFRSPRDRMAHET